MNKVSRVTGYKQMRLERMDHMIGKQVPRGDRDPLTRLDGSCAH